GPEQRAVASAARAVGAYVEAVGTPREASSRQVAAQALNEAWHAMVSFQPAHSRADTALASLRRRTRGLNALFARTMEAAADGRPPVEGAAEQARQCANLSVEPPGLAEAELPDEAPLGHPDARALLRESLRWPSMSMLVVVRVGIAAIAAGAIGALLDLERAYWAVAAAVLMLHQGREWLGLVQRSIERVAGTWIGLLLAGALLWQMPQGLWLVALIVVL